MDALASASGGFGGGGGSSAFALPGSSGGFGGGPGSPVDTGGGGGGAAMGGAIFNDNGSVTISNATFYANSATGGDGSESSGAGSGFGGAVFNYAGPMSLLASTFVANRVAAGTGGIAGAADGSAIYSKFDSQANCSAGGNPCTISGLPGSQPALVLSASIAARNRGGAHDVVSLQTNVDDLGYTYLVTSVVASYQATGTLLDTIVSSADPQTGTPGHYGGGLLVVPIAATSPAHDATACAAGSAGVIDERGASRPQGPTCDAGAYEIVASGDDYIYSSDLE
jgi:hypothetical protein